jgi:DNA polymerase-1
MICKPMIVDFSNMMYRAFYAVPQDKRKESQISGVYIFYRILKSLCNSYSVPMVFAMDCNGKKKRQEINIEYKAQRKAVPDYDEFRKQWNIVTEMLKTGDATFWKVDDCEADDLIFTFASKNNCYVFSNDKDFDGVVRDGVNIIRTGKFSKFYEFDIDMFYDKYEFDPKYYNIFKSLVGDESDNIKGIKGWGLKKAIRAIKNFDGDVESMIKNGYGKHFDSLRKDINIFHNNMKIFDFMNNFDIPDNINKLNWIKLNSYATSIGLIV